jgi:hypothetical protein
VNINLNIFNEKQDCKIGTAWGKKEIKVTVYGR